MTRMNCKLKNQDGSICGQQIDYNPDTKTAKNLDGTDHKHAKKKEFTNKEYKGIDGELQLLGKISNLEATIGNQNERLNKLELGLKDAWEAIAKLSYTKGNDVK